MGGGRMSSRGRVQSPAPSFRSTSHGSGSQYALCTLGVGLVALGVVMIVWTVVPAEAAHNSSNSTPSNGGLEARGKTSSIAFVLVGAGLAMLLLAICLGVRNKRRQRHRPPQGTGTRFPGYTSGEQAEAPEDPAPSYDVPSYEEAVGSGQYPIRQSNLRMSTSQLPSYEDLLEAVQNEAEPQEPSGDTLAAESAPDSAHTGQPPRRGSRSSRILRPLRVRRIKSEKLHLRDVRLNIVRGQAAGPAAIEPLTPPPQYEEKVPEL